MMDKMKINEIDDAEAIKKEFGVVLKKGDTKISLTHEEVGRLARFGKRRRK